MSTTIPAARMRLPEQAPHQYAAMLKLERSIELHGPVKELVKVRASQINGCAFCIDMHWKDARAAGETEERLYMLSAWRESRLYDDRERAALALTEAMTLIASDHVSDPIWDQASTQFGADDLAQLIFVITAINAWNRLMIATETEPGHYQAGQRG